MRTKKNAQPDRRRLLDQLQEALKDLRGLLHPHPQAPAPCPPINRENAHQPHKFWTLEGCG
ncbi:MAG: hypothetical protein HC915_10300 [Anaerolineae bacterium]|nr:hypothetical protein [Anaerolineae bacterium]